MKTMMKENRGADGYARRFARWMASPVVAIATLSVALPAWSANIESVEFSSLPGDKTEIRLHFDGTPPEPTGYTIEQPARIVLDMPGVASALEEKHHNLGIGNARRVSIISTKDRTRAIVNLTELVGYETEIEGNTLYLMVGAGSAQGVPTAQAFASADDTTVEDKAISDSVIRGVDFRRSEDGDGRIIIQLSNPKAPVNVSKESGRVRVEVRNTDLPAELQRRLDVTDFATPVQIVDALQEGAHTTFTITATGDYDYLAYQADNTLTVNVNALTEEEIEQRDDVFKYSGEKLSLNFQDIEVRSVLQLIADFTDLNLVASDTVSGRITLRPQERPLGSGPGAHSEDQGSGSAAGWQRIAGGARGRDRGPREARARESEADLRARSAAHRVHSGPLCQCHAALRSVQQRRRIRAIGALRAWQRDRGRADQCHHPHGYCRSAAGVP